MHEPRADRDVAAVRPDELQEAPEIFHGMLSVGIDPAAKRVTTLVGLAVAGRDAGAKPAVLAERDDDRTPCRRDRGCRVCRAVVDHEHVRVGQPRPQLVEHGGQRLLLVPRGDEDDGVGVGHRGSVLGAAPDSRG
jgi:hypothetical protein